jgi:hypothetical protein
MKPGGVAIVPHEPFHPFPDVLQPVRPMALWSYTRFDDPRFEFSQDFMRLRADPTREQSQKFGLGNKREWCAYQSGCELFVKRFPFDQNARYADFGCNNEIYTAGAFIEVESLSPLQTLLPGESARHEERWELIKVGTEETQLSAVLNRLNGNG